MSILPLFVARRAGRLAPLIQQQYRSASYWNRDWRPADNLPKTEEEKRAAARKYGLIPEDYETYPDDGTGYGDYPKLPLIGAESRDPHALYDIPELKRNFGEPMPVHADMIGEDRWNYGQRLRWSVPRMLFAYLAVMGAFAGTFLASQQLMIMPTKMMPKHLVHNGKKHYSFELE